MKKDRKVVLSVVLVHLLLMSRFQVLASQDPAARDHENEDEIVNMDSSNDTAQDSKAKESTEQLIGKLRELSILGKNEDFDNRILEDRKLFEKPRDYQSRFRSTEDFGALLDEAHSYISKEQKETVIFYNYYAGLLILKLAKSGQKDDHKPACMGDTLHIGTQVNSVSIAVSKFMIDQIKKFGFLGGVNSKFRIEPNKLMELVQNEDRYRFRKASLNNYRILETIGRINIDTKTDVEWAKTMESVRKTENILRNKRLLASNTCLSSSLKANNAIVVDKIKMTHQELVAPLMRLLQSNAYQYKEKSFAFIDQGHTFDVNLFYLRSRDPDLVFDDNESRDIYFIQIVFSLREAEVQFNIPDFLVRSIHNYGFYGAQNSKDLMGVDPEMIYRIFHDVSNCEPGEYGVVIPFNQMTEEAP